MKTKLICRLLFFLLFFSLLFVFSCANLHTAKVINRNFNDEVDTKQSLIFTFNQDLVPDSVLKIMNDWDTIPYLEIIPNVPGKFRWSGPNELIFAPLEKFMPCTNYKVKLTDKILKHAKKGVGLPDEKEFTFHTPYLKLAGADIFWIPSQKVYGKAEMRANLNFNYPVDPPTLNKLLHVVVDNKEAHPELITTNANEVITFAFSELERDAIIGKTIKFSIDKGFRCLETDWVTKDILTCETKIPSPEKLEIKSASGDFMKEKGFINVLTTQGVIADNLKDNIKISPNVNFTVETTDLGFQILGDFRSETSYDLTISGKLKGVFGGELGKDYFQIVAFGKIQPMIKFTSAKGVYLSPKSSKNVGVNIINVPEVRVKIVKIYENNILHYMRNHGSPYYNGDEENDYGGYNYGNYGWEEYGDEVYNRVYKSKDLPKNGDVTLLNLNLNEQNNLKGIYLVTIESTGDDYVRTTKLISISDIGFIVKQMDNEMMVFANSIKDATSLNGINMNFISTNNQTMYTATTNQDGVAVFSDMATKAPKFKLGMITARNGEDFNYILLTDTKVEDSRYDVGGRKENPAGYQCFIYGDRNIYRPGETVHINTILRNEQWETAADMPIKIKVTLPNGQEFKVIKAMLDKQGSFETSFPLQTSAVTGNYAVDVYSSNDVFLNSYNFNVEEFMPDRIKVDVNLSKPELTTNDSVTVTATALNMYGPPAANKKYEMEFSLRKEYFSSKDYPDYDFNLHTKNNVSLTNDLREGRTDEDGKAKETFKINENYEDIGLLDGKVFVTVFDETGRPVNRSRNINVYTQKVFYGIKNFSSYLNVNEAVNIPLIAVNKDGKSMGGVDANVQVIKCDYKTVIEKTDYGRYHYVSQKQEKVLLDQNITTTMFGYFLNYLPKESGEYQVRIKKPGTDSYVAESFYAYGWGHTATSSFQVNKEGQVTMELNKDTFEVGETAKILFKTPFQGRLLVTVERNKVFEYYYLNTDKKSAMLTLPVKDDYLPNVYITATLFKPLDDGAMPMTVAHGFTPLLVKKSINKLPVVITAVDKSRSKTKQTIHIKTVPLQNVEVTLAVVDEGILALKNYKTPDPYGFFYQKRALEVGSYDIYPYLFPDLAIKKSSVGGDGYDLGKRVNPLANKRVQLVAFWSGILHTDAYGNADYTIDIPQFSGDLRIMAVAYKDKAFGSAEKHMKVADPIVISPALPRFFSPRDTAQFPVTIANTTNQSIDANVTVAVDGAVDILGENQQSITVAANSEKYVEFQLYAKPIIGEASINVNVGTSLGTFTDKTDITVRPSTSLLKMNGSGAIDANGNTTIDLTNDFISGSVGAKLYISKSPVVQFADNLSYLVQYPYGCVEQTVSSAFPQLYYADIVKNLNTKHTKVASDNPTYNVQEAIKKLQSMQLYNGSLSYWQGGYEESWWGTVYAAHFLREAEKAGYEVSSTTLNNIYNYLSEKVKRKDKEIYHYYDDNNEVRTRFIAPKEIGYSLYVLALAKRQDVATMDYYKSNLDLLALDSKYLLAGAFLVTGDRKSYNDILPKIFDGEYSKRATGGSFYSAIRDEAISLNVLLENDPSNQQVGMMVKHLTQQMKKQKYLNTQERTFAFLALGKFMKAANNNVINATVSTDGATIGSYQNGTDLVLYNNLSNKEITINTTGSGTLYYFCEIEGISADGKYKEEDSNLKVRKTFYDRNGKVITNKTFHQGDLVVIRISAKSLDNNYVDNVVITDMLPAGLEIENPRIGSIPEMEWVKNNSTPQHFDIRDDRINLFTSLNNNEKDFYYVLRAVSKGNFKMGPVSADAMYDAEYHSYNGAGTIRILE